MSYSVTGIQSIPLSLSFPSTDHASGGVIHPQNTKATVDQNGTGNLPGDTVQITPAGKFKVESSSHLVASHAVLPAKPTHVALPIDTVTLSTADKVRSLRQQGEGNTQIASTLNLPIKEVQSDLHLDAHVPQAFTVAPVNNALSSVANTPVATNA